MLWLFLAVIGKHKWVEGISPLHLPHKGECSDLALGRVGQVGRVRPVRSVREPILIRAPSLLSCFFVGLKHQQISYFSPPTKTTNPRTKGRGRRKQPFCAPISLLHPPAQ